MLIEKDMTILFQGDSITDYFRDRNNPDSFGDGYVYIISQVLQALYPEYNLKIINRGISGFKVPDLYERWKEDCIDLKPDIVTIFVGINDCWHKYIESFHGTPIDEFTTKYEDMIKQVKEIGGKVILIEPMALVSERLDDVGRFREEYRADLTPIIQSIRHLAVKYAEAYIPLDGIFAREEVKYTASELLFDGVHPTQLGNRIIALEWLKAVKAI